jgi:TrmH family RNA methyltransferase
LIRADVPTLAAWVRHHGLPVVGTSDAAANTYTAVQYRRPTLLLMGSEREGLSPPLQALAGALVRIPMVGRGDSLNLAVATSILLYEMFNRGLRTQDSGLRA